MHCVNYRDGLDEAKRRFKDETARYLISSSIYNLSKISNCDVDTLLLYKKGIRMPQSSKKLRMFEKIYGVRENYFDIKTADGEVKKLRFNNKSEDIKANVYLSRLYKFDALIMGNIFFTHQENDIFDSDISTFTDIEKNVEGGIFRVIFNPNSECIRFMYNVKPGYEDCEPVLRKEFTLWVEGIMERIENLYDFKLLPKKR